jgi:DKNYY family
MNFAQRVLGAMIGLVSLLTGCSSKEPYQQRNGIWTFEDQPINLQPGEHLTPLIASFAKTERHGYFRGVPLETSDGGRFEALDEHYAKDQQWVYYCDAYRVGQDYFSSPHRRVKVLEADPASFRILARGYARDANKLFFEGQPFPVKDVNSFEILEYGFARDRSSGYYQQTVIPGSNGGSFAVLDNHYSKDKAHVFYSDNDLNASPVVLRHQRLDGAILESFTTLESGYAKDAKRVYHKGKPLASSTSFEVLSLWYAKTDTQVFYNGKPVTGADAKSFVMLEPISEQADSKDSRASYQQGRKVSK